MPWILAKTLKIKLKSNEASGWRWKILPQIQVNLFANLRRFNPGGPEAGEFPLEVEEGSTVNDLFRELGVLEKEVKNVFVNNLRRQKDYVLQEGDRVGIFPPVAGG